jgi:hypothetical protein
MTPLPNAGNQVNAGLGLGTMRVMLGYDRIIWKGLSAGVRVGFAFGGGPQKTYPSKGAAFFPVHGEGRVGWWFRPEDQFSKPGIRPYVMLSGGVMEIDAKVVVTVVDPPPDEQTPPTQTMLEAWTKKGLPFAALGGGAMFAITPGIGPLLELKVGQLFGSGGTFVAGTGGFVVGF